jgi:hypothetical protein
LPRGDEPLGDLRQIVDEERLALGTDDLAEIDAIDRRLVGDAGSRNRAGAPASS